MAARDCDISVSAFRSNGRVVVQSLAVADGPTGHILKIATVLDLDRPIRFQAGQPIGRLTANERLFAAFSQIADDQAEAIARAINMIDAEGFEAYEAAIVAQSSDYGLMVRHPARAPGGADAGEERRGPAGLPLAPPPRPADAPRPTRPSR